MRRLWRPQRGDFFHGHGVRDVRRVGQYLVAVFPDGLGFHDSHRVAALEYIERVRAVHPNAVALVNADIFDARMSLSDARAAANGQQKQRCGKQYPFPCYMRQQRHCTPIFVPPYIRKP